MLSAVEVSRLCVMSKAADGEQVESMKALRYE